MNKFIFWMWSQSEQRVVAYQFFVYFFLYKTMVLNAYFTPLLGPFSSGGRNASASSSLLDSESSGGAGTRKHKQNQVFLLLVTFQIIFALITFFILSGTCAIFKNRASLDAVCKPGNTKKSKYALKLK